MRIFLVGFMGAGKTTVGKRLALKTNSPFFDFDHILEAQFRRSINDYFEIYGEEKFRKEENKLLQTYQFPENCVISTGGGTPCFFDNMKLMGICVYLNFPAKALAHRLSNAKINRPLIKELTNDKLLSFIEETLQKREEYYLQSDFIVDGLNITAEKIIEIINNYPNNLKS